jgi:general secretion pathway protein I
MSNRQKQQNGFTLIEIIISLVVISVALGAVIATTGNSVKHGSHIQEKTIALWVAKNEIANITIEQKWLSAGVKSSNVKMAGNTWYIKNEVTQTPDKNMRKMDVAIFSDRLEENKVVTISAYIVNPKI